MKNIQFSKPADNEVEVTVDGSTYGVIKYDADQSAWVLWPEAIDDGVSYFDDLAETEEAITDEIQSYTED